MVSKRFASSCVDLQIRVLNRCSIILTVQGRSKCFFQLLCSSVTSMILVWYSVTSLTTTEFVQMCRYESESSTGSGSIFSCCGVHTTEQLYTEGYRDYQRVTPNAWPFYTRTQAVNFPLDRLFVRYTHPQADDFISNYSFFLFFPLQFTLLPQNGFKQP